MSLLRRAYEVAETEGINATLRRIRRRIARAVYPNDIGYPRLPDVEAELDEISAQLRTLLYGAMTQVTDAKVWKLIASHAPWYQRIELPEAGITTTSDPDWVVYDLAPDNTLGGRLTPAEAAQLRPLPKFAFIRSRLPDLKDATVLEVGSNNGFFSFEFAKLGAREVTGIEAIREDWERANVLVDILGLQNVRFELKDWCFTDESGQYDIVFSSEVVGHLLFPFYGIYKMLSNARQFVVLDHSVSWSDQAVCSFDFFLGYTRYHSFTLSDRMITDFLVRCGIKESAIQKHPYAGRCLYVINVGASPPRGILESTDDPQWSGKFIFDPKRGIMRKT